MNSSSCKICKRIGEKVFLKGDRCTSPKCSLARGSALKTRGRGRGGKRKKSLSEYGLQLQEKQKIKFGYGLREKQFKNYAKLALGEGGTDVIGTFFKMLELRLDNVAFRVGFAASRSIARQMVSHGHINVNGRRVDISSRKVKIGDKISIRQQSLGKGLFKNLEAQLQKHSVPAWMKFDQAKMEAEITGAPAAETEPGVAAGLASIIEFYNR